MTTNKISDLQQDKKPVANNPLTDIAGKFGGEFWRETLSEIQLSREIEKEEMKKLLDDLDIVSVTKTIYAY